MIVLLLWLFLSSFAVLLGAELDAEIERQTARDTTTGPDRPLGERDAEVADTVGESPGAGDRPADRDPDLPPRPRPGGNWEGAYALPEPYVAALVAAGAQVALLPPRRRPAEALLAAFDGLLLAGGGDIEPARYGAADHRTSTGPTPTATSWSWS